MQHLMQRQVGRRTKGIACLASTREATPPRLSTFVVAVIGVGATMLAQSMTVIGQSPFNIYAILLAALIMASSRFVIKVPGRPATVSVSEVFVFTSVLLFGPAVATLTVAMDGVWISLRQ